MKKILRRSSGILLLLILIPLGCSRESKKIREKDIIPPDDLVPILVDLHIGNSMFSLSSLRNKYPGSDSISNYQEIIGQHGYTVEDFEKTLTYYEDHLEDYLSIYDRVLKKLNDIERDVLANEAPKHYEPGTYRDTLWNTRTEWHLPREGRRNKIPFSIPVEKKGVYTLSARIRLHRDDQSKHPTITAFFWYANGSKDGMRIPMKKQNLVKDNQVHLYIVSGTLKDNKITHLKGFLLDHENPDTNFVKHADVFDVRVDFKPLQGIHK
ncbi:MAG: DUF4296 domain-containing protein [Chlorobi bacterium]|nr:DUF4296 domain-containing protein [Chlorobiota bacterium]